jgi:hypothetical protein
MTGNDKVLPDRGGKKGGPRIALYGSAWPRELILAQYPTFPNRVIWIGGFLWPPALDYLDHAQCTHKRVKPVLAV